MVYVPLKKIEYVTGGCINLNTISLKKTIFKKLFKIGVKVSICAILNFHANIL